jgi:hypothetical protein
MGARVWVYQLSFGEFLSTKDEVGFDLVVVVVVV